MRPASPTPAARSRARHPLPSQRAGRPDALAHISIRSVGLASLATAAVIGLAACDALVQTIEPTPTLITQRESVRQRPMVPVVRGDLIEAIRTTARVEAEKRDHLFFKTDGRVQLIKVRQGDRVKAGDVLATLEPGRLEADIASAQEAVNTSQLRLDAARNKAVNEKAQAESKLANAELALEKRQLEFERVLLRATPEQATALGAKPAAAAATPPADPAVSDAEASLFRAQQSLSDARARLAALEVMGSLSDSQAQAQAQAELMPLYASQAAALRDLAAAREEASRAGLDRASAGTPLDIASASARVQEARRALAGAELRLRDLEAGGSTAETAARESAQGKIDAAVAGVSAARARLAAAENAAVARNAELTNMAVSARAQAVDRLEQLKSTIAAKQLQLAEATTALDGTVNRPTPLQVAEAQAILEKARLTRDDIVRTGSGASAQAKEKAEIDYQVAQRAYKEAVRPATAAEIASARATADLAASALTLAQNELVHVLAGGSEAAALERLGQEYRGAIAQDAASAVADRDVARSALAEAEVALAQLMGAGTMTQAIERVAQEILADSALTLDGARADVAAARARITAAEEDLKKLKDPAAPEQRQLVTSRSAEAGARAAAAAAKITQILGGLAEAEALAKRAQEIQAAGRDALPAARAALAAAEADVRAKQARLNELTGTPTVAQLRVAQANVAAAQLDYETAQSQLSLIGRGESATDFELKILAADLEKAKIGLKALTDQQGKGVILASFDGEVTFTKGRAGSQVSAFEEIIGLADPARVVVEVRVADQDHSKLSVGQPAEVALDAFPGVKFQGSLSSIPRSVVTATGQTVVIPTAYIDVSWNRKGVKIGMLARVNITLQTKSQILKIPVTAVKTLNERTFVETVVNEQRRSLPVVTGIKSDTEIEVVSGLEEGQMIFAAP